MKLQRLFLLLSFSALLMVSALPAFAKDFTQADLERIVNELDKVIPHNDKFKYPVKCSVVDKDDVNAYATVTKEGADYRATMVVFGGLVKAVDGSERLIRATVAHELTHLSRGHMVDLDPTARDLRVLWTRQQEFEADKGGAEALVKCGYPKKDMVDLLLFLDKQQGRSGGWLWNLTADHADPKARAAEVSDNPSALQALVMFDTALAYEDARNHLYAQKLFDLSVAEWPELTEAYTNSAKCSLLFYYDNLPSAVRASWWRPDFGPLITNVHASPSQAVEVTDQDREAWKDAYNAANLALEKNLGSIEAQEVLALTMVLEPDAKKEIVDKGIAWFNLQLVSAKDSTLVLRYANNAGVGQQRLGDLTTAYHTIMAAEKGTQKFNSALGENLGLVVVKGRSKDDDILAANVLYTWLSNTPDASPRWDTVKRTFDQICATAGVKAKDIEKKPGTLCRIVTINSSGKEMGILLPVSAFKGALGDPERTLKFTSKWPDLLEMHWHGDALTVLTEREKVMRITTSEPGAFFVLKPVDTTSQASFAIKVGMTKDELFKILPEDASQKKDLAQGGEVKVWNYYPDLGAGVLIEGDVVKAITVSPVAD